MQRHRIVLEGNRRRDPVSTSLALCDPSSRIEVTLKLRPRRPSRGLERRIAELARAPVRKREYLTRQEHEEAFGARSKDVALVEKFAQRHCLTVVGCQIATRAIRLSGTVGRVQRAFGVRIRRISYKRAKYHSHHGKVSLPRELKGIVRAVFGLDTRPLVRPHFSAPPNAGVNEDGSSGFSPTSLCKLYNFPPTLDGSGQCVAIVEVNSPNNLGVIGSGYFPNDLDQFASALGISTPAVSAVAGANGAGNHPGINRSGDLEVALDIQVATAAAPGASFAVYFGVNCEQGYHDALSAAINDKARNPSVISISWGHAESEFTANFMTEMDQMLAEAGHMGITICVSAGDYGSSGKAALAADGVAHASFPATSPSVLTCGGTIATVQNGAIVGECVWNLGYDGGAGGGGVSESFQLPVWQTGCNVPASSQKHWAGRGVPDLAAHADIATGYNVIVKGSKVTLGGTSAVAPMIAGLFARINQARAKSGVGPAGFVNPTLYKYPGIFRTILLGNNDIDGSFNVYNAQNGWSACAGLGAPDGTAILNLFL